jgi:hypothetical protein
MRNIALDSFSLQDLLQRIEKHIQVFDGQNTSRAGQGNVESHADTVAGGKELCQFRR